MEIFYIASLTLIAATIDTITGFGTSTLTIPVLVIFFPPVEAIFLVAIIHWFGDVWKIALFRKGFDFRLIALFGLIGLATSFLGAFVSVFLWDWSLVWWTLAPVRLPRAACKRPAIVPAIFGCAGRPWPRLSA